MKILRNKNFSIKDKIIDKYCDWIDFNEKLNSKLPYAIQSDTTRVHLHGKMNKRMAERLRSHDN